MDNNTSVRYNQWKKRKIRRLISLIILFFVTTGITFVVMRLLNQPEYSALQQPTDNLQVNGSGIDNDYYDDYEPEPEPVPIPREPVVFCGLADQTDATVLSNEAALDYLALVNRCYRMASDFSPHDLRFVNVPQVNTWSGNHYLRESAATALEALFAEINAIDGMSLVLSSAYRDFNLQALFFNNNVDRLGLEAAMQVSAMPGHSEHQLGLGADLSTPALEGQGWLTNAFSTTPEGEWVGQNAHRFGFIISFPYNQTENTGFIYEPWHLRYVGVEIAAQIFEQGLVLEEFLWYR